MVVVCGYFLNIFYLVFLFCTWIRKNLVKSIFSHRIHDYISPLLKSVISCQPAPVVTGYYNMYYLVVHATLHIYC